MSATDTSALVLEGQFAAMDAAMAEGRMRADKLRTERAALMLDWNVLIAAYDFDTIAQRAGRLAEIGRDLARIGQ